MGADELSALRVCLCACMFVSVYECMHVPVYVCVYTCMYVPQTWVIKPVTAADSGPNGPKSMVILGIQPAVAAGITEESHAKIG